MPLLRSQEAWVFQQLTDAGFDPREFRLTEGVTQQAPRYSPVLTHEPSGFYFAFAPDQNGSGGYWVEFSPGEDTVIGSYGSGAWDRIVVPQFDHWLVRLQREIEAPDLWGELRREGELVAGTPDEVENTPFTAAEQAEVQRHLEEVKQLLRANHALTEAQIEALDTRLDYLADATTRLGRIDWREAFVGAMLGLVLQAVVPQEPIRDAMSFVLRAVGHMFGVHVPELGP